MGCVRCGKDNPSEARFCGHCGHSLVGQQEAPAGVATPIAAGVAEEVASPSERRAYLRARQRRFGGFWWRLAAHLVDGVVLAIGLWVLGLFLDAIRGVWWPHNWGYTVELLFSPCFVFPLTVWLNVVVSKPWWYSYSSPGVFIPTLVVSVLPWMYYSLFTGLRGWTPGKLLLGLRVVGEEFQPPGVARAFLRESLGKVLSSPLFFLGFFWIGWSGRKQGWHDMVAGTMVVATSEVEKR